jgi:hypothetical protein
MPVYGADTNPNIRDGDKPRTGNGAGDAFAHPHRSIFKGHSMATLKFNIPQVDAYRFRQGALREGRSLADFVRRCAERGLSAEPPVEMANAAVDCEEMADGKITVAAYLSGKLAGAIKRLAAETGRSQSHVMRDLIRSELRNRSALPTTAAPTAVGNDPATP